MYVVEGVLCVGGRAILTVGRGACPVTDNMHLIITNLSPVMRITTTASYR